MSKKLFYFPAKNLTLAIPLVLLLGFATGIALDTAVLKSFILPATFLMIYPTMIGFQISEAYNLKYARVLLWSLAVNFLLIPAVGYTLGLLFLKEEPLMMAGLVLASLLPTSGMTISWTMLFKGNVAAAIKITAISLILGSLTAPWYLLVLVGKVVPVNVGQTFVTIAIVVLLPLILGNITFRFLVKKYSREEFQKKFKPVLPALSVWAMLFVIFASTSMRAPVILKSPGNIGWALVVLSLFYIINFTVSTVLGRIALPREDAITLVYGTVMRNLSLSLGLAASFFGPQAALIVTLAFILQVQGAAWYGRLAEKLGIFNSEKGPGSARA